MSINSPRRWASSVAIPACTVMLMAAAPAPGSGTVYLTTYLRAGPGDQYAALDEVEPHSTVQVKSCDQGWCKVRWGGADGFIEADVLSAPDLHAKPTAAPEGTPCVAVQLNGKPHGGEAVRVCAEK